MHTGWEPVAVSDYNSYRAMRITRRQILLAGPLQLILRSPARVILATMDESVRVPKYKFYAILSLGRIK